MLATYTVTNTTDAGAGSLRDAITQAVNAANLGVEDTIAFNIAGAGVQTVHLGSTLTITARPSINGYSQNGASSRWPGRGERGLQRSPLIGNGIPGSGPPATDCKSRRTGSSTVRGLVIIGFNAVRHRCCDGSANNVITGNFIGTDAAGTSC